MFVVYETKISKLDKLTRRPHMDGVSLIAMHVGIGQAILVIEGNNLGLVFVFN